MQGFPDRTSKLGPISSVELGTVSEVALGLVHMHTFPPTLRAREEREAIFGNRLLLHLLY